MVVLFTMVLMCLSPHVIMHLPALWGSCGRRQTTRHNNEPSLSPSGTANKSSTSMASLIADIYVRMYPTFDQVKKKQHIGKSCWICFIHHRDATPQRNNATCIGCIGQPSRKCWMVLCGTRTTSGITVLNAIAKTRATQSIGWPWSCAELVCGNVPRHRRQSNGRSCGRYCTSCASESWSICFWSRPSVWIVHFDFLCNFTFLIEAVCSKICY